jgi:quercetin dioxygenase-like cupin family protein
MKACTFLPLVSFVLLSPGAVLAQDPVKVAPERYKVVLENSSVRVLAVNYPAGAKAQMHSHPDAIFVPLNTSKVRFTMPDGKSEQADMTTDSAVFTPASTHSPANVGTGPAEGLLIEFKAPAPGMAKVPTSREAMNIKVLAEGSRAIAYQTTADPTFVEPAGTTHEYDQVVIALHPSEMSLSIAGKPARTKWARGDVAFIGRGVAHESKNTSGKPVEFIIVAIK